jgi:hypothetical protein
MNITIKLAKIAHVRAGDKANVSNVALFLPNWEIYEIVGQQLTEEKVKQFYGDLVKGKVLRYDVPNLQAYNFVMHDALGGGAASSLRIDNQGKNLGAALLRWEIEVPEEILSSVTLYSEAPLFQV